MSAGHRIFRNIRALAAAKAATMASGLVTAAWTARVLGPDSFGVLGFGTSLMAYAALFVNMGLSTYAIREIARDFYARFYHVTPTEAQMDAVLEGRG